MTAQRILVVGGGYLGLALGQSLGRAGHGVTILSPRAEPSLSVGDLQVVRGHQEDGELVAELLREHATVIHAAWGTTPGSSGGRPVLEVAAGLKPFLVFLETLRQYPSVRLLFLSSGGTIYGEPDRLPVVEDAPLRPRSCHGAGKAAAELFLGALGSDPRGAKPVILRPANVYGPGQPLRSGFGIVRNVLQCVIEDRALVLWGDGSQVRDYLYIDDFIDAVSRVVKHPGVSGVFNVGSGAGASLRELIALVERETGCTIRIDHQPHRPGDVGRIVLDIAKIRQATGWEPVTSLLDGVAQTWRGLREVA